VVLQLWFFLTPILYSFEQQLSARLHRWHVVWLYLMNPVAPVVMTFQRVIYSNEVVRATKPPHGIIKVLPTWPATTYLAADVILFVLSAIGMFAAVAIFGRLEGNFAEEL
jgi:ABC-2 type transport system permease protein